MANFQIFRFLPFFGKNSTCSKIGPLPIYKTNYIARYFEANFLKKIFWIFLAQKWPKINLISQNFDRELRNLKFANNPFTNI